MAGPASTAPSWPPWAPAPCVGGLFTAHRSHPSTRLLAVIGVFFGALIMAVALAPTKLVAIILLVPMGAASISFIATNNATLQLRADPAMRGRVMSLNAIAFLGSTPIGAPLLGYISDVTNPRVALSSAVWPPWLASVPLFFLATRQREARAATLAALTVVAGRGVRTWCRCRCADARPPIDGAAPRRVGTGMS